MSPESNQAEHSEMHDQKKHKKAHEHEMQRARRLMSAQQCGEKRKYRRDSKGHRQTGPDNSRKDHENDAKISQPLHHIISPGFIGLGFLPAQMRGHHADDGSPIQIPAFRQQVSAEMPR